MENKNHLLPTADEIRDRVLSELRIRREAYGEDFTSYIAVECLLCIAANDTGADVDPELSEKFERRTRTVLRQLERDGLVEHWKSENWYLTDEGMQLR